MGLFSVCFKPAPQQPAVGDYVTRSATAGEEKSAAGRKEADVTGSHDPAQSALASAILLNKLNRGQSDRPLLVAADSDGSFPQASPSGTTSRTSNVPLAATISTPQPALSASASKAPAARSDELTEAWGSSTLPLVTSSHLSSASGCVGRVVLGLSLVESNVCASSEVGSIPHLLLDDVLSVLNCR